MLQVAGLRGYLLWTKRLARCEHRSGR